MFHIARAGGLPRIAVIQFVHVRPDAFPVDARRVHIELKIKPVRTIARAHAPGFGNELQTDSSNVAVGHRIGKTHTDGRHQRSGLQAPERVFARRTEQIGVAGTVRTRTDAECLVGIGAGFNKTPSGWNVGRRKGLAVRKSGGGNWNLRARKSHPKQGGCKRDNRFHCSIWLSVCKDRPALSQSEREILHRREQ